MFLTSTFIATMTVLMMTTRGDFVVTSQRKARGDLVATSVLAVAW
jgi:hypothetical protein